jgi:hypothetical protein
VPEILDRGMGPAPQSLSLSLDSALNRPLQDMTLEELQQVRDTFKALDSAAPAMLEHMIDQEEQAELPGFDGEADHSAVEAAGEGEG